MGSIQENIQLLSIRLVPFIMAVVFHEFAHGFVAKKWGDKTAESQGRLTLNPIPHIDILGTLIFPIVSMISGANILFGWAKPVPINPSRFKNYKKGMIWVSLAGPGMNFLLAVLSAFVFFGIITWVPSSFYLFEPLRAMAQVSVILNFSLGIFNLIPLPPLDGSKVVEVFLPYEASRKYQALTQYSFFILMALLWTGVLNVMAIPIYFLTNITFFGVGLLFGGGF